MVSLRHCQSVLMYAAIMLSCGVNAEQFIPANDNVVLEELPRHLTNDARRRIIHLRAGLADKPQDITLATTLAREYIEQTRHSGDPRYLGYAQAILAPWHDDLTTPTQVLLLRAMILQSNHDFMRAIGLLDKILNREPDNAQARLTRASLLQLQGNYTAARNDCRQLRVYPAIRLGCYASIAAATGHARLAYQHLHEARATLPEQARNEQLWLYIQLAEVAVQLNMADEAEKYFRTALHIDAADQYTLAAFSDFLLDQDRYTQVTSLLADKTRNDALLLRLTIAQAKLHQAVADDNIQILAERFAENNARGDYRHLREEARYYLELRNEPGIALTLSLQNWLAQKESVDARLVIAAAVAAGQIDKAHAIIKWVRDNKLEHPFFKQTQIAGILHP